MTRHPLRSVLLVALAAILAGCIVFRPPNDDQGVVPAPGSDRAATVSPATPAAATPSPPATETASAESDQTEHRGVFAVTRKSGSADFEGGRIQPVDAATLEPVPGIEPMDINGYFSHTFSPDGRTLALLVQASHTGGNGGLHLIDLESWTETVVGAAAIEELGAFRDTSSPRFTLDGDALYWTQRMSGDDFAVLRYDPEDETASAVTTLPESFSPTEFSLFDSGQRAAIFGRPISSSSFSNDSITGYADLSEDPARVLIVDLANGQITTTITLEGIMAGNLMVEDAEEDNWPIHISRPGLAWDNEHALLYVAHPSDERVTVVDLMEGAVQDEYDFNPPASVLERFTGWLFPSAGAVARAVSNGHAVLSPSGDRLYAASIHEQRTLDDQEYEETELSAVGVIDTTTGEIIDRLDLGGVQGMALSPNGEQLLIHTYPHLYPLGDEQGDTDHRLHLLDPATGKVRKQIDLPGRPGSLAGRTIITAGDYAYLRVFTDQGSETLTIDPATLEIVGRRHGAVPGIWFIHSSRVIRSSYSESIHSLAACRSSRVSW